MLMSEIIKGIRELLSDPDVWLKDGNYAACDEPEVYGPEGVGLYGHEEEACKWCTVGALHNVTEGKLFGSMCVESWLDKLCKDTNLFACVTAFNDHHTTSHKDLMDFLDHALSEAKREESNAQV